MSGRVPRDLEVARLHRRFICGALRLSKNEATKKHIRHTKDFIKILCVVCVFVAVLLVFYVGVRCGEIVPSWNIVGVGAAAEAEGFHFAIEARAVVVEDLGGPFDVAAGSFESLRDRFAFDLFHRNEWWNDAAKFSRLRRMKLFR